MKKLMLFSLVLISVLFVVAGCQPADDAEALAGQAIKSDVLKCGKNAECNQLAKSCILAEKCTETANACKSQCSSSAPDYRKCMSVCNVAQSSCASPCYDSALAATLKKPVAATCVDSDTTKGSDGHDKAAYLITSKVKDEKGNFIWDTCNADGTLTEQLCSGGYWEPETIDCAVEVGVGYVCDEGRCEKPAVKKTCVDSDAVGGSNGTDAAAFQVKGSTTTYIDGVKKDTALDDCLGDTVYERYCNPDGTAAPSKQVKCAVGVGEGSKCGIGACVTSPVIPTTNTTAPPPTPSPANSSSGGNSSGGNSSG
ncbi:hypothetical protein HY495_02605 [Candidatus Woesearchaeota archaeon]|nr:hypothetical protein [Candidatus Woesearchaeota archaeon]